MKGIDHAVLDSLGGLDIELPAAPAHLATGNLNHTSTGSTSSVEEKALKLLGSGVNPEQTALALGVTASRISQLMAEKAFSDKVANLRYAAMQSASLRDKKYDTVEDKLLEKLEAAMPLMVRPDTILKAISTINGAKRRGQSAAPTVTNQQNIVQLILPSIITQKFTTDINNQVVKTGAQELLTMHSGILNKRVETARADREAALEHTMPSTEISTNENRIPADGSTA
tara:strand:+ start:192 stop:875 length:684 start_codon:yes stop_codon:yes gene_type:complete